MKPIERLELFIEYLEIRVSNFEKKIGVANNTIGKAISKKSNLKDETVGLISRTYPQLNLYWFILGIQTMLIEVNDNKLTTSLNEEPELIEIYNLIHQLEQTAESPSAIADTLKTQMMKLYSYNSRLKSKLLEVKQISEKLK